MSNFEISKYFEDEPNFGGVLANDQLQHPWPDKVYILNLQNIDQAGSHWVTFYNGYYWDSYGMPPTKHVAQYTRWWNKNQYQSLAQNSCGYHAAYVAANILAGRNPEGKLIPNSYQHNERVLKQYFY